MANHQVNINQYPIFEHTWACSKGGEENENKDLIVKVNDSKVIYAVYNHKNLILETASWAKAVEKYNSI